MCDDGLPLPIEEAPLDRSCAATLPGLAPLLASPLFAHSSLLVQTTGGCWELVQGGRFGALVAAIASLRLPATRFTNAPTISAPH